MTRPTIAADSPVQNPAHLGVMLDDLQVETIITMINEHAAALDTAGVPPGTLGYETVTSGALDLTKTKSYLSVTNSVAFTLADGTAEGQTKRIECSAVSGTPIGTLTIATGDTALGGASALVKFTAVGQALDLEWSGTAWHATKKIRAGVQAVTVGTTVLTGYNMCTSYALAVVGTEHSTTTKGIPAGVVPGERFYAYVASAGASSLADISITAKLATGVAATSWANIGNSSTTKDSTLSCEWDGAAWQTIVFTAGAGSATLS